MRKYILLYMMLSWLPMVARGQTVEEFDLSGFPQPTQATALRYWFDGDAASVHVVNGLSGRYTLDVAELIEGLHTIHFQVMGANGEACYVASSLFMKMGANSYEPLTASKLMYWFDDETTIQYVDVTDGVQLLDASELIEGLHTIHYQVLCNNGQMTPASSSLFLRISGDAGSSVAKSIRYWFDDDAASVKVTDVVSGTQTLDVSNLLAGLHTVHYQLIDNNDQVCIPTTRLFLKTYDKVIEDGRNRITQYEYWINENPQARQTVMLDDAVNPYTLIALLPVQQQPLRTSLFHFELTDGEPTIYSKNILHTRFHDAVGYFTDSEKPYIDYRVKQTVTSVGELQATQTFDRVSEGNIRWYTVQAAPGDTLAFRLSQAATLQLYAPSGEELFKTSEAAAVQFDGLHVWEDGTYYLAVHDVTGTRASMTLDYIHMDKYDVVDQDVRAVGNGGCSTITFRGNGFRDLYAVDLYTANGDSILSIDISHDSDAETAVTFDFTGTVLGVYNAVFHFTEEDKVIDNCITVEEPVDIKLATDVSYPTSFLRGTSITYTIKVTNEGNMTAYQVPLEMRLKAKRISDISRLEFGGQLASLMDLAGYISNDSIDAGIIEEIKAVWRDTGDLSQFALMHDSIDNVDYGISFAFMDIPPKATRQITVTIRSSSEVYLSAYMTSEWYPLLAVDTLNANKIRKGVRLKDVGEWLCCYRERVECVADVVGSIVGSLPGVPPNINCGYQVINTIGQALYVIGCSEGSMGERFHKYAKQKGESFIAQMKKSALDCAFAYFFGRIESLREDLRLASQLGNGTEAQRILSEIETLRELQNSAAFNLYNGYGIVSSALNCISKFRTPIPNCPPHSDGGGGNSIPVPPADPNDIFGYLSEAGNHFIADSVARVHYTIEFENDTTLAQAAAHTIVIRDTLDAKVFDRTHFVPTSVKLGGREVFLDEADVTTKGSVTSFVKTIDVRPEINAIAQVEGTYSTATGIAEWRFKSLDPMTMEETDDVMQGILPVNYDGTSGIGEVMFEVGVRPGKADGTEIRNRASIVFDYEEAIQTPTWVNTVDAVTPTSTITDAYMENDSTMTLCIAAEDNRSGVWYCDVYAQYGKGTMWVKVGEHVTDETFSMRVYEDIDYGFCVVATDSAGNVERKVIDREWPKTDTPVGVEERLAEPDKPDVPDADTAPTYDLQGRPVEPRQPGVYVQRGKKRLVKK